MQTSIFKISCLHMNWLVLIPNVHIPKMSKKSLLKNKQYQECRRNVFLLCKG